MARPRNQIPSYKRHAASDTARCWINGKWVTLGKYNSPQSRKEYAWIVAELGVAPGISHSPSRPKSDLTVNEVLLAFLKHAAEHYRGPDGGPTTTLAGYKASLHPVRELYGHTTAVSFGPLALKAVRRQMIEKGLSRGIVNQRVGRIKKVFKWAASEEMIPVEVFQAVATVGGLERGRSGARETDAVKPVEDAVVEATLGFLGRHVVGLIQFQRLTGCRPGEAVRVRPCEIDTSADVWLYHPPRHKTSHRGKTRTVAVGPQARALLEHFTPTTPTDFYFSPARAEAERLAALTARRKTPPYPSHLKRHAANRKGDARTRKPGERYSANSFAYAIARACKKHDLTPWHPHQLRHTHATKVRKTYGLEAAGAALGHAKMSATEVYAERDAGLAARAAAEIG